MDRISTDLESARRLAREDIDAMEDIMADFDTFDTAARWAGSPDVPVMLADFAPAREADPAVDWPF